MSCAAGLHNACLRVLCPRLASWHAGRLTCMYQDPLAGLDPVQRQSLPARGTSGMAACNGWRPQHMTIVYSLCITEGHVEDWHRWTLYWSLDTVEVTGGRHQSWPMRCTTCTTCRGPHLQEGEPHAGHRCRLLKADTLGDVGQHAPWAAHQLCIGACTLQDCDLTVAKPVMDSAPAWSRQGRAALVVRMLLLLKAHTSQCAARGEGGGGVPNFRLEVCKEKQIQNFYLP